MVSWIILKNCCAVMLFDNYDPFPISLSKIYLVSWYKVFPTVSYTIIEDLNLDILTHNIDVRCWVASISCAHALNAMTIMP